MPSLAPSSHQAMSSAMVSQQARKKSVLDDEYGRAARNRGRLHHNVTLKLVGNGLVREVGSGPQDPKRRYFLATHHH